MKLAAWVLASGIIVLVVAGCGGGEPQVEERPDARPSLSPLPTTATTTAPTPAITSAPQLSIAVAPIPRNIPKYDRAEWRHWTDEDDDCQNARQEALIAESDTPVEYTNDDKCKVASGSWQGPYTGETFTDPGALDIDHVVPLANAHRSGGWSWNEAEKRRYANDLSYDGHLIAVEASANRLKGSKAPDDWKPPNRAYWCQYAIDWITVKNSWQLTATESEATALKRMLDTCEPPRSLAVIQVDPPHPVAPPTLAPTSDSTYPSCAAAEEAGEPRALGSRGDGRGFPAAMVPNARDGDGDGMVCER